MRRGVQPVDRFTRLIGRFPAVWCRRRDCFARLLHAQLGSSKRRTDLRWNQSVLSAGLPYLLEHLLNAFLDRGLLGTGGRVLCSRLAQLLLNP